MGLALIFPWYWDGGSFVALGIALGVSFDFCGFRRRLEDRFRGPLRFAVLPSIILQFVVCC